MQEAEQYFRNRYREILDANPWLTGRLVYDSSKKPVIIHPSTVSDDAFAASESDGSLLRINPPDIHINPGMAILPQSTEAAKCDIPWGYAAIGDPAAPLLSLIHI